jgi:quercetin dioxygenase-like cupin family protein
MQTTLEGDAGSHPVVCSKRRARQNTSSLPLQMAMRCTLAAETPGRYMATCGQGRCALMNSTNPTIVTAAEGTHLDLLGDAVRVILRSEDTGGSLTLVQQRSHPGAGVPLHINTREDEIFQILEGEVEFHVGEQTLTAEAGTTIHVPRHLPHSFRVVGQTDALIQISMVPGGLEKMVEEIIQLPKPPDRQKVAVICERYGIKFLHH